MPLTIGDRLGPYEISGLIGKGGMGEVYRARDTRLERTVAIKVLPAEFSAQEERLRRFEQEARVLGAFSHPNLLAIHDVGSENGTHFLVSELLDGESLRQRLQEGALPVRKAMDLGIQIAKGLAAAPEKGIVHRDIKPDNIFLTRDGRAKILDFGLAKQSGAEGSGENATITAVTDPGMVLGTAGYMSPEQVRGKVADARSDIFSFGAILYEVVAGLRAFHGDSSVEMMNAILKEDPPPITGNVPPAIERVIRRCLEKAPDERFQSARDLAFALEALSAPSSTSAREAAIPAPQIRRSIPVLAIALGAAALGAIGVFAALELRKPPEPIFRQLVFGRGFIETARFTPDGQNVVYGASWSGKPFEIFTTGLDGLESRSLGLPPANILGIGANGQMAISLGMHHTLNWMTTGTLAEVSLTGGAPRPLLDSVCDGDMSPDGKRAAIVRCSGAVETLEFPSGTVLFRTSGYISSLRMSRDAGAIAFAEHPVLGDDRGFVTLVDLQGKSKRLTAEWSSVRGLAWGPSGKEIWFTASENSEPQKLMAVDRQGKLRNILQSPGYLWLQDISTSGKLLLGDSQQGGGISFHSATGTVDRSVDVASESNEVDGISADGTQLSVTYSGANSGVDYTVYLAKNDGSTPVRIGDGGGIGITPDGKHILVGMASATSHLRLYPTGTGDARDIDISPVQVLDSRGSWTSDGSRVAFTGAEPGKPPRIYVLDLAAGKVRPVTGEGVTNPFISPDGHSLIARNAQREFALYPLDGGAPQPVKGIEAGETPVQFGTGGKLYTWDGAFPARIMVVDLQSGQRQLATTLAPADPAGVLYGQVMATPDGKTFTYRYRRAVTNLFLAEGLK
ncbi:MAG TPA: protein kinase [Bryobacteraceae bacterium]|nr:protein kinase [Bryobacteraceae bacterium]